MQSNSQKRILFAPLDWGMGHATRCIPLVKRYQQQGYRVVVAAPKHVEIRLRLSLDNVEFVPLFGYEIKYHKNLPVWFSVCLQAPKIRKAIRDEHRWLLKNSDALQVSLIVSDNRYGMWHPSIPSILLTHQLQPIAPFGGFLAKALVRRVMRGLFRNFSEIHVPDFEGAKRISGTLSERFDGLPTVNYIGPLSRFTAPANEIIVPNTMLAILSGPEPHYSRFYKGMQEKAKVEGRFFRALGWKLPKNSNGSDVLLDLNDEDFAKEVAKAERIVCSAGFSTLCDLHALERRAELYPTPGQTEQEYLAKRQSIYRKLTE